MSKIKQASSTRAVPVVIGVFLSFFIAVALPVWAHLGTDEQIAILDEQIAAHPDDAALYVRRGELHRHHMDWEAAEADYRHAKQLDDEGTHIHFLLGRLKLDAGDAAGALSHLNRYLTRYPTNVLALVLRARGREQVGRHLFAASDFTLALEHTDKPLPTYYLERARALEAANDKLLERESSERAHTLDAADDKWLERAISGLDEGLERLGEPVTLQLLAIDLELKLKRYDAAIARVQKIAASSARQETWTFRRAEILESAGRGIEALSKFRETLDQIQSLICNHRKSRAVQKLEEQALEAIARLEKTATPTDLEQSP
jgi:tetratricopeptide (TPR) repeat protein